MASSAKYEVYLDADVFGGLNPFNLQKDLKQINDDEQKKIAEDIGALMLTGPRRPTYEEITIHILEIDKKRKYKITYSKLRACDEKNNKGKSNGYRCIAIINNYSHQCIVLHVYGKNKQSNITHAEENKVKDLLLDYYETIREEIK